MLLLTIHVFGCQPLHRKIILDLLLEFLKVCKDFHSKGEGKETLIFQLPLSQLLHVSDITKERLHIPCG